MDWMKQLNKVMDYIDVNLQSRISYDKISEIACCKNSLNLSLIIALPAF